MTLNLLETDYLIIGAGAMGMAFADEVLTQSPRDRVILVDKHARPGGHWNDAYPFVSLHQPAAFYGVNSENLGPGGGALASGAEVLSYYERVLRKLLASGRCQHFGMCESQGDGSFKSLVETNLSYRVKVHKKTVNATYMNVQVPSIRDPQFEVTAGVSLVPPNELPKVRKPRSGYVILGAGKTGIDSVLFLLDQGVDPDHITWIMPNDAWLLDRDHIQPGRVTKQNSPIAFLPNSTSLDDLFRAMEADDRILRLDKSVWPTKYRCATVDQRELEQLRRIQNVVRMGRVTRIDPTTITLRSGSLKTDPEKLHVDCTADGLAKRDVRPIFQGDQITLQSLFMCQQVFSAAVIGYVETHFSDDDKMNALCQVVPHPEFSRDFVLAIALSTQNMENWARHFMRWLRRSRLSMLHHDSLFSLIQGALRTRKFAREGKETIEHILKQEFPELTL